MERLQRGDIRQQQGQVQGQGQDKDIDLEAMGSGRAGTGYREAEGNNTSASSKEEGVLLIDAMGLEKLCKRLGEPLPSLEYAQLLLSSIGYHTTSLAAETYSEDEDGSSNTSENGRSEEEEEEKKRKKKKKKMKAQQDEGHKGLNRREFSGESVKLWSSSADPLGMKPFIDFRS